VRDVEDDAARGRDMHAVERAGDLDLGGLVGVGVDAHAVAARGQPERGGVDREGDRARRLRAEIDAVLLVVGVHEHERRLRRRALQREGTLDLRAAIEAHAVGGDADVRADLRAEGERLQALQQARVGGRLAGERLQRFGLAQLGELVDELARVGRLERILVLDLRHEQLGEHVGRGRAVADRQPAGRLAPAPALVDEIGLHRISLAELHEGLLHEFTRPRTSTLVSKAREADIMSVISATELTLG
jgi:hypothetical protein